VEDAEPTLRRWISSEPGLTLEQLRERLALQGIEIKTGALWHQLNKWNLTFKKTLHASEQEREDVQAARLAWSEAQPTMAVEKLVFIDETGAAANMTRS
jgi:transposase